MGFSSRISPTNRIREQINLRDLVDKHGLALPIEPNFEEPQEDISESPQLAIHANLYVFSGHTLGNLVDEIVEFSYQETFNMIKRKMQFMEENE